MKLINNNLSPLPFYDNLAQQNHRKDYSFGQIYPLIVHKNKLMPFQIVLEKGNTLTMVKLHNVEDGSEVTITGSLFNNGLSYVAFSDFTILKYPGLAPVEAIQQEGQYYLILTINRTTLIYSDIFTVCNSVDNCLLIEYSNSSNLTLKGAAVDFSDGFKFSCYVCAQIGKPEYIFEEEATERMGYTFIESQVSKKVYRFTFLAPEYLCDALRIVRLCDNKQISSGGQIYDLTSFSMEPKWEEQGDLASVECEFETDTVIANIGGFKQ